MTKRFTAIIIIFNVIMDLILFLSIEQILFLIKDTIVGDVGIFIDVSFLSSIKYPPTLIEPLPNYPLFIFIFTLVVNVFFIVKLRRSRETKQTPS
jgi:hypothetical protein